MLEIIPQIKTDYPELKIILLTTYDSQYFKNAALQLNVNAYLFKNTQKEEVLYAEIDLAQVADFRNEHPFQKDRFIR
jgi:DNA-binding NarL/FixJ family response regulator